MLKFSLFSLIFMLQIILQSSAILVLAGLCLWVLFLILLTSPLWIPLSICWAPAALITYLVFRYTEVKLDNHELNPVFRLETRPCYGLSECSTIWFTRSIGSRNLFGRTSITFSLGNIIIDEVS
jgi:hypothetical protein